MVDVSPDIENHRLATENAQAGQEMNTLQLTDEQWKEAFQTGVAGVLDQKSDAGLEGGDSPYLLFGKVHVNDVLFLKDAWAVKKYVAQKTGKPIPSWTTKENQEVEFWYFTYVKEEIEILKNEFNVWCFSLYELGKYDWDVDKFLANPKNKKRATAWDNRQGEGELIIEFEGWEAFVAELKEDVEREKNIYFAQQFIREAARTEIQNK
ncbi:MAG: hypothetical protein K9M51_02205 [Candidatus Gracilibacteria bacterium]|nr:hypothetical protein [Candidatus Gracilibacteria bacterium]